MRLATPLLSVLLIAAVPAGSRAGELPTPVEVRPEPEGITLDDPAFEPLPGARADFGRLGGAVYKIEMPDDWNGRLVLYMHGFEEFASETQATPPDGRRYLIGHGYAWGASSFSSTSLIPGRSADETAALWDHFASTYGRPRRTYITGLSMGGMATHIAAERYPDRFDGAMALCGAAGMTPAMSSGADFFAAAAYAAGVTQAELDATTDVAALIDDRIVPSLDDPATRDWFERILVDLTGGPRPFGREGIRLEEATNFRRIALSLTAAIAPNRDTKYRLGPLSRITTAEYNQDVVRLPLDEDAFRSFIEGGEVTGDLRMPLLTLHTTGDGQVPIEQARILRRRVGAAGKDDLLVQRVFRDAGHCGFTTTEQIAALEALVRWVEHDSKPKGDDVLDDLRTLDGAFELSPRVGTPEGDALTGLRDRIVVRGNLVLDGAPFDAQFLGAIVVHPDGLVTPCQGALPPVVNGRYEIPVMADAEVTGCGAPGDRIVLWTFVEDQRFYSVEALRWPGRGTTATFDATFSTATPDGAAPPRSEFSGEVFDRRGRHLPPGTVVEAYIGDTRCGVTAVRDGGSFTGYILAVVGPESIAGCAAGATISFRIDGRPAADTAINELGGGASLDLSLR